jgi:hypothetical protein
LWSYLFPGDELIDDTQHHDPTCSADDLLCPDISARDWVDGLHAVFETVVGNLVFSFGSGDAHNRRLFSVRYQPGITSGADYLQTMTENVYNTIMDLEHDYCVFSQTPGSIVDNPMAHAGDSDARDNYSQLRDAFWRNTDAGDTSITERIRSLSFRGYWFKPDLGKNIFQLIQDRLGKKPNCDQLDRTGLNFFFPLNRLTGGSESDAKNAQLEQRRIYFLAKKIAFAQFLVQMMEAEDYVNTMVNGTFDDGFVRTRALRMIRNAAGTDDLAATYKANLAELQWFAENIHSTGNANHSRSGLGSMIAIQDKSEGDSTPEAPSGIQG